MRTAETARRPAPMRSTAFVSPGRVRSTSGRGHRAPTSAHFGFDRIGVIAAAAPSLEVSQPWDAAEREADRIADQVLRMPAPSALPQISPRSLARAVARKCRACAEEDEHKHGPGALDPTEREREDEAGAGLAVDRDMPLPDELIERPDEPIPMGAAPVIRVHRCACGGRSAEETRPAVPADLVPGIGTGLAPSVRAFFEPRFGFSFDRVRVHTGGRAAATARSLDALAYTVGNDIVFGAGQFAPETDAGQRLLAHELTHVVQQNASRSGGAGPTIGAAPPAVGRTVVQRWTTSGTAPTTTNTIVCDGSGGIRVQVGNAGTAAQAACLTSCIRTHEQSHRSDALAANANICDGKADQIQVTFSNETERKTSEYAAYDAEISCLNGQLPSASDACKPIIRARITQITPIRDSFA